MGGRESFWLIRSPHPPINCLTPSCIYLDILFYLYHFFYSHFIFVSQWINLNYITFHGLFNYGLTDLAMNLRQQTLDIVTKGAATPREYYNPLTGSGLGAYNYMWTGALLIATINEMG